MRELVHGLQLPEALRSDGAGLYFSDAIAGGVHRWTDAGVETVIPKRRGVGGIAFHADGGVVASGRTLIHARNGETRELFSADGALGLNDLTVDAGRVLVGALRTSWAKPESGSPGEVWRIGGPAAHELLGDVTYPNGIGFSPNGALLYVADFVGACVHELELNTGRRRVLAALERGNADGLAVDAEGRVWVATGSGDSFDVFDPRGGLVERLAAPASFAVTLCFGGEDGRDLFLAAGGCVFRTRSEVPGLAVPAARV